MKKNIFIFVVLLLNGFHPAFAQTVTNSSVAKTEQYFQIIKKDPAQLYIFLHDFPKGGDLHNHLAGATYAENLQRYAKNDNFCVDPQTFRLSVVPMCPLSQQLALADTNPNFYRAIVNSWSMNEFVPGAQSGEAHFFSTFLKFLPVVGKHPGEILAELAARAGEQHVNYLELMIGNYELNIVDAQGNERLASLGSQVGWNNNFAELRAKLLQQGLGQIVQQFSQQLDGAEKTMRERLHCGTANADLGCQVKIRYQYYAVRAFSPEQVFAELLGAFEAAKTDHRVVGINIVAAEDGPTAVKDYLLHMQMIEFLHKLYPTVHISLHAGELAPDSVPPEVLRNHIRQAIEIGHAERIGHGVAIYYENNTQQLLQEMAKKHIMVEINLTSNEKILDIKGNQHPLPLYLRYHVPVALSTDDEGVLRTHLTREYQRAVLDYDLSYATLKTLSRNSLAYSFLSGLGLWLNVDNFIPVAVCQNDVLGAAKPSMACQEFLAKNEKAQMQWQLEGQFAQFERKY